MKTQTQHKGGEIDYVNDYKTIIVDFSYDKVSWMCHGVKNKWVNWREWIHIAHSLVEKLFGCVWKQI